jgi:hypothetical protein
LAITLDVGAVQETVTVTSEASQLNVSDPNLGLTVDRKRVDELPSVHGDPYHLINLAPGLLTRVVLVWIVPLSPPTLPTSQWVARVVFAVTF